MWHVRGRGHASSWSGRVCSSGSSFLFALDLLLLLAFEFLDAAPAVVAAFVAGEGANASVATAGASSFSAFCFAAGGGFFLC